MRLTMSHFTDTTTVVSRPNSRSCRYGPTLWQAGFWSSVSTEAWSEALALFKAFSMLRIFDTHSTILS